MRTSLFITLVFFCTLSFGQESGKFSYKNSIQLELFGHGSFYSLNYERVIFNGERFKTLGQAGIAYYTEQSGVIPLWIPLSVNQLFSFHSNHIEVGLGQIIINDRLPDGTDNFRLFGGFKAGYRYQKPDGRILIKAAFTPLIDYSSSFDRENFGVYVTEFIPWGGLTFGYNF
ncbi:MAG: hypothetical protein IH594_12070 [Bacteroidales bacterium]|nr:hypothetical protein [Bacteroidales bacterium]